MEILTHIGAFLVGLGAGWTLKIVVSMRVNKSSRTTVVSQKSNNAGGDIVAGDVRKD